MTCNPFDADSDYEEELGSRRSSTSRTRRVSFTEPSCGSIVLGGRKGSLYSIPEVRERGSIFALFENPFGDNEGPRRLTLSLVAPQDDTTSITSTNLTPTFQVLTAQQTHYLRKRVLYKGEYRILNISVIVILLLLVTGITFLSAWHYTNRNWWAMYVVLGVVVGGVVGVLVGVKTYFRYKRYHGSGPLKCTTADLMLKNSKCRYEKGGQDSSVTIVRSEVVIEVDDVIKNYGFNENVTESETEA